MTRQNPKIVGNTKDLVCKLHARGLTGKNIHRELAKLRIHITQQSIWNWLSNPQNTPDVQKAIDAYRSDPLAVAIAHKRVRLEDLNKERVDLITTLQRYKDKDGAIYDKKFFKYLNGLKRLIEMETAAREEIERRPDMVAYFQRVGPYADASNEELRKIDAEITSQLLIICRQGATKAGIDSGSQDPPRQDKG